MNTASYKVECLRPFHAAKATLQPALLPGGLPPGPCALERQLQAVVSASVIEDLTHGCVDWYYYEESSPGQHPR
jgi:hypothetical protein